MAVLVGAVAFLYPLSVKAAGEGMCFCGTDLKTISSIDEVSKITLGKCAAALSEDECIKQSASKDIFKGACKFFLKSGTDDGTTACGDYKKIWEADRERVVKGGEDFTTGFRGVSSKLIPECLLKNELSQSCRDVSIFVYFLIQLARYLFGVIGALALIMFVYGGFTLILSQGSSEKVKKGGEIIVAAIIGLVIMFGAYMLVSFLGEAVNIQTEFKLK